MIVLMVPQGAALKVDRVAEVAQAAGADVIETRAVPVPETLFDRRTVHNLLVSGADTDGLSSRLRDLSDQYGVDIALQSRAARCQSYRLAVFDMDSTLIDCEVIDQLAAQAGVGEAVAEITAQAMRHAASACAIRATPDRPTAYCSLHAAAKRYPSASSSCCS